MKNILIFGDSIAQGEKDPSGGWTQKLRRKLKTGDEDVFVYNLGVAGDTTRDILHRFEDELESRRITDEPSETILIFQVGINDSMVMLENNSNQVSIEEFRHNIEKLILKSKELADKTFFLGLTPVIENKVNPLPWDDFKAYRYKSIRLYEDALYEECDRYDTPFIEIYDYFADQDYSELLEDGIHPNTKGHELIAELVEKSIEEKRN